MNEAGKVNFNKHDVLSENLQFEFCEYNHSVFSEIRQKAGIKLIDFSISFDPRQNHKLFKRNLNKKNAGKSGK